jgi:hypothetical protein
LYKREESKIWWMRYRDKDGIRRRESTLTEDWDEAQKRLRERLQARDNNMLPALRRDRISPLAHGRTFIWRTSPAAVRLNEIQALGPGGIDNQIFVETSTDKRQRKAGSSGREGE